MLTQTLFICLKCNDLSIFLSNKKNWFLLISIHGLHPSKGNNDGKFFHSEKFKSGIQTMHNSIVWFVKKKSAKINFKIENKFTSVNKIKLWAIRLSICTHECIVYEAKYHKVKKRSEIKTTKRHRKQTFYYYDHILCHRHAKLLITHIIYFHTTHTTYYWLNWSKFCLKLSWIWRGKHGFKLQCRCWVLH